MLAPQAALGAGEPVGAEFRVNVNPTIGIGSHPRIRERGGAGFGAVWRAEPSVVVYRRLASDGTPLGTEEQVNNLTATFTEYPDLAHNADGSFVVLWAGESYEPDTNGEIVGQWFNSNGVQRGDEFQVNTYTQGSQRLGSVLPRPDDGFLVIWQSDGSPSDDSSGSSIQARAIDRFGDRLATDFQVNTYTPLSQESPRAATDDTGTVFAAWESAGEVRARQFDSSGLPVGDDFQVNQYSTGVQNRPTVAAVTGSRFIVAWSSEGSGLRGPGESVRARIFDQASREPTDEFQVNDQPVNLSQRPGAVQFADEGIVVTWTGRPDQGGNLGIYARLVRSDGPFATDIQLNDPASTNVTDPGVLTTPEGTLLTAWATTAGLPDVRARRFRRFVYTFPIFADGFEFGDVCDWDTALAAPPCPPT